MRAQAAIFSNGKILLQLRSDIPVWSLPGGGLEPGESPKEAVIREVREETGLSVKVVGEIGKYSCSHPLYSETCYLFACKILGGHLAKNSESLKLAFFEKLPGPMFGFHKERILDALAGRRGVVRRQKVDVLPTALRIIAFALRKIFK